ncbi:MAG: M48 family metallopeptidase [Lachnospiraceae bacterium]|nr:M48 family metallopeptidase [Lachnospiraceae bacterium]
MNCEIELIRSRRKTIQIEVKSDLRVIVRAPLRASKRSIVQFIEEKQDWIEKSLIKMQERRDEQPVQEKFTPQEIKDLKEKARAWIPGVVDGYAEMMGLTYGRISIRTQRSRWGSCSAKGNLNFNCVLMLLPEEIREYVIVHELCHIRELNHSARFWNEVEKYCPDYRTLRKRLRDEGETFIRRL